MGKVITSIKCQVIDDSRGRPTISVTVEAGEHSGSFGVPSGASTGVREVHAKPAAEAVVIINDVVAPALIGQPVDDQLAIDRILHELDSTQQFDVIGGNVALGVSVATTKAAAEVAGLETWQYIEQIFKETPQATAPRLFVNLINGGQHAERGSSIQEHQIIVDTDDVTTALEVVESVQAQLRLDLFAKFDEENVSIGDEGGFVIPSEGIFEPFLLLDKAVKQVVTGPLVFLGSDMAASSFYEDGDYQPEVEKLSTVELLDLYSELHTQVPSLRSVEDPLQESDFEGFSKYLASHPELIVIGDDLTTTNEKTLEAAIATKSINAIIIKPNQIGTVSDTLATMRMAYQNNIKCIVSHRSGETMDNFIADLAYGTKSYGLKAGAPDRPERAAKYQRLLEIVKN